MSRIKTTLGLFVLAPAFASCAALIPGPADDKDPELVQRSGKRALVMVDNNPFQYGKGGYSIKTTGPGGTRTQTVQVSYGGWNRSRAGNLEAFFEEAMTNSKAFYVVDRATVQEIREDESLRKEGILKDKSDNKGQLDRPDLKLVCTLTKLDENAGGSKTGASGGGFSNTLSGWLRGGGSRSTKRAECAIQIKIVDRRTGRILATARGEAFSVGSSKSGSAYGWSTKSIFGGGSNTQYENPDVEAATRRATVRAVNDLIKNVPDKYFKHE